MGTGQMLLTVLAVGLLGKVILSVNTSLLFSGEAVQVSEYRIDATSLGTSILEQADGLAFDEQSADSSINSLSSLTPANKLGMESGESYPNNIDDFDDFNNLTIIDSTEQSAKFTAKCTVSYVKISGTSVVTSSTPTWNKQITVKVYSASMPDTLTFTEVFSYWYYR
jgi:hypothetical protein